MKLAIVGTRHTPDPRLAAAVVEAAIVGFRPEVVISGGADGIDSLAAESAVAHGIAFEEYLPRYPRWEPEGYKARNQRIAQDCDVLVCIRSRTAKTFGSSWTANEADRIGRTVYRWEMP